MVLPGRDEEGLAPEDDVRRLRSRNIPLQNPTPSAEERRQRTSADVVSRGSRGSSLPQILDEPQLSRGRISSSEKDRISEAGSRNSRQSNKSKRLQARLEEMEAELMYQKQLRELQQEAERRELQRREEELRQHHEVERLRRELRRASVAGSQVSHPPSIHSFRAESPHFRTAEWVTEQVTHQSREFHVPPPPSLTGLSARQNQVAAAVGFQESLIGRPKVVSGVLSSVVMPNVIDIRGCDSLTKEHATGLTGWDNYWAKKSASKALPDFDGDPAEWLNFITTYRNTLRSCNFSGEENIARLGQALKGKARESVKSLLSLPNASGEVIRTLELLYGRPILIINNLIEKVRKFSKLSDENAQAIVDLSVKVSNLVVAMECLEHTEFLSNPQLVDEIVGKLSPALKLQWGEFAAISLGGKANLSDFKRWLDVKAVGAAHVSASLSNPSNKSCRQLNIIANVEKPTTNPRRALVCYYCKENHVIRGCPAFKALSLMDRRKWVRNAKLCFICLSNHMADKCKFSKRCGVGSCKGDHHMLLHPETGVCQNTDRSAQVTHAKCFSATPSVLLKILPVRLKGPNGDQVISALLDEGANCTLLDWAVANSIGLKGEKAPLCIQWIHDIRKKDEDSEVLNLSVTGVYPGCTKRKLSNVRTVRNLGLPSQNFDLEEIAKLWPQVQAVGLQQNPGPPKMLIGQDHRSVMEPIRTISQSWNGLALSKTRLGWVLHGRLRTDEGVTDIARPLHVCQVEKSDENLHHLVKDYFSLDFLGTNDRSRVFSPDDRRAIELLDKTARLGQNRWEVGLLWKSEGVKLRSNFLQALQRLKCVEKKLDRDPKFANQYTKKIEDYLAKGYAHKLSRDEINTKSDRIWYLPHLAVFNPNKPGKIRVVFDASAKVDGVCLNNQLLKGPDLYNSIPDILMRFRRGRIAFGGDIKEMYLQIKIRNEDQDAQRFLWRGMERNRAPDHFAMSVMLFGAVCSPFQAQEIKNRNASRFLSSHPKAVKAIHDAHYMDDYLDSADSEEEAVDLIKDVLNIHRSGGFEMVNWVSNSEYVLRRVNSILLEPTTTLCDACHTEKVLGMRWNPSRDTFVFRLNKNRIPKDVLLGCRGPTKREFLRIVMSIYDPLGFLGWFLISAKIILQDIWRTKIDWDEEISQNLRIRWDNWQGTLGDIEAFEIPRCYTPSIPSATSLELHVFCDASDRAYAALAYLRVVGTSVVVSLIAARYRVAPLKQVSVPRLELQAAVLGVRLCHVLRKGSGLAFDKTYFWSDSKTVLHWISHSEVRYRMFVAHRVGEILESSVPEQWRWLPGSENPADDATKGNGKLSTRWLQGPEFLRQSEEYWPICGDPCSGRMNVEVLEQLNLVVSDDSFSSGLPDVRRFSNFVRLVRVTAWMLRFIDIKVFKITVSEPILTMKELRRAEECWWRNTQSVDFTHDVSQLKNGHAVSRQSRIFRLSPFLDSSGVLRVGGRIELVEDVCDDMKHPIILDPRNLFVKLLIDYYHRKACHQGQAFVANELRQKYWILGLRRAVRSAWYRCLLCTRQRSKPFEQPMAPLPRDRLNHHSRPFTTTGLDYFGPLYVTIKRSRLKRYVALFSCMTTRAIHLELVTDLTTDGALLAIRRMLCRRGCPKVIWSDNGTNFRGASRVVKECLRRFDQKRIIESLVDRGIEWKFLPPAAPHMGGCWERLIGSVKKALMATMKCSAPREDVLVTLLAEAENLVNSRPLTTVSEDTDDPEAITPNHFLIGDSNGAARWTVPEQNMDLRKRWQLAQRLTNLFWKRWLREYLPSLIKKTKWFGQPEDIRIGQLVYLADPKQTGGNWKPARVVATFPGQDGVVRVVDVRTKDGVTRRPITSLLPLLPAEK